MDPKHTQSATAVVMLSWDPFKLEILIRLYVILQAGKISQKVFLLSDQWPTKDGNMFVIKYLTLVPDQKKELESDLVQDGFVKELECVPRYKVHFEFKTKIQASKRSHRTSLVLFLKLIDKLMKVKKQVDNTVDIGGALVVGEDQVPILRMPFSMSP